jgi:hypothetical protein
MHISAARPFGDPMIASGPEEPPELLDSDSEWEQLGYVSSHAHLGTAGRETIWGSRAASGPEELRAAADLRSAHASGPISTPPAAGPARGPGPWAASGQEELRDSEWSHGCRRDAGTVRFQYLVPQVTVSDDSLERSILNQLRVCSVQNSDHAV